MLPTRLRPPFDKLRPCDKLRMDGRGECTTSVPAILSCSVWRSRLKKIQRPSTISRVPPETTLTKRNLIATSPNQIRPMDAGSTRPAGAVISAGVTTYKPSTRFAGVCDERALKASQISQPTGYIRRTRGAIVTKKIAVPKPDHLGPTEEGERLQRLVQTRKRLDRLAGIGSSSFNCLVIHAPGILTPALVHLPGTLGHGKVVIAMDEGKRMLGKNRSLILRTLRWHLR